MSEIASEIRQDESTGVKIADNKPAIQIIDPKPIPHAAKLRVIENLAQYIVKRIKQERQHG